MCGSEYVKMVKKRTGRATTERSTVCSQAEARRMAK